MSWRMLQKNKMCINNFFIFNNVMRFCYYLSLATEVILSKKLGVNEVCLVKVLID